MIIPNVMQKSKHGTTKQKEGGGIGYYINTTHYITTTSDACCLNCV